MISLEVAWNSTKNGMPVQTNLKRLLKKTAFNLKNGLSEIKLFEQQSPKHPHWKINFKLQILCFDRKCQTPLVARWFKEPASNYRLKVPNFASRSKMQSSTELLSSVVVRK